MAQANVSFSPPTQVSMLHACYPAVLRIQQGRQPGSVSTPVHAARAGATAATRHPTSTQCRSGAPHPRAAPRRVCMHAGTSML